MIPFSKQIRNNNLIKYKGKPPTIELIDECVKKSGVRWRYKFERIYGITEKSIERYAKGLRPLPLVYWHIFYEYDNLEKFYATFKIRKKREVKEKAKQETASIIASTNKNIIDAYRARINQRPG